MLHALLAVEVKLVQLKIFCAVAAEPSRPNVPTATAIKSPMPHSHSFLIASTPSPHHLVNFLFSLFFTRLSTQARTLVTPNIYWRYRQVDSETWGPYEPS